MNTISHYRISQDIKKLIRTEDVVFFCFCFSLWWSTMDSIEDILFL